MALVIFKKCIVNIVSSFCHKWINNLQEIVAGYLYFIYNSHDCFIRTQLLFRPESVSSIHSPISHFYSILILLGYFTPHTHYLIEHY